jgi:hypothetical protein
MQRAAPGEIVVDAPVREAAAERFHFTDLGALALKGKDEAVLAYRVDSRVDAASGAVAPEASRCIGRAEERAWLAERIQRVVDGRSAALIVDGEAGIGKSQLVRDAAQKLRTGGVRILATTADAIDQSAAYHPWRRVVHEVLDLDAAPEDPEASRAWIVPMRRFG